jgi:hypothetical protein
MWGLMCILCAFGVHLCGGTAFDVRAGLSGYLHEVG